MTFEPQVDPSHYAAQNYETLGRFVSYGQQIDAVMRQSPESVLEVGIGSGFVSRYLRDKGIKVHTVDADERLGPDTVATFDTLPWQEPTFDVVCCFETLEHLPWEQFQSSLAALRRVSRRAVLISLPDRTPFFQLFAVDPLFLQRFNVFLTHLPALRKRRHVFDGQHYWEVGKRGYELKRVCEQIEAADLQIAETHRVRQNPLHRFFTCLVHEERAGDR